jgi:ankyrin repeat protein
MKTQNEFYWAMAIGDLEQMEAALKSGKVLDVRSSDGAEALFFAVEIGNLRAFQLLVEAGASPHRRDDRGRSLLHAAARWNRIEILDALPGLGLDLNARADDPRGCAPIHEAAQYGALEAVQWLVVQGAETGLRLESGETPADLARERGHLEILHVLNAGYSVSEALFCWSPLVLGLSAG